MENKEDKKLRSCLGLFTTGVVIACARKKNFFSDYFFAEKLDAFSEKIFKNKILKQSEIGKNLLERLKKIFADEFFGMTINSFSSLSLEPPLVMFSIDNKSSNLKLFKKNNYFSLNILSGDQIDLAKAFALTKNHKKWTVEPYFFGKKGNPIFKNSLGFFECKKHKVIKAGDHHIIIGEVVDFEQINKKPALIYHKSSYSIL